MQREQCSAKSKQTGLQCKARAIEGGKVCRAHGGASPAAIAKAKERLLEARIQGELAQVAIEPVTNPIGHLAELGGEVLAWLELCRRNLEHLRHWETSDLKESMDIRPLVAVYERALDRAVSAMERMARLGLDAETLRRQLKLEAERPSREQAEVFMRVLTRCLTGVVDVLTNALAGVDLTPAQQAAVIDNVRAAMPRLIQTAMTEEGLL